MTLVSGIQLPIDRIAETCQRYGVKELAVFGSASRGGMGPGSDVDMLVEFCSRRARRDCEVPFARERTGGPDRP